ncbi:MAG: CPBP family intramembrane glutamic endopeptidase [Verrucomicrobiia bacterium]
MIRMNVVKTIVTYAVIVVVAAALAAPGAFWLCQVSGIDWLAGQPFHRICDRTLLATALIGLWPLLRCVGVRSWRDLGYAPVPRWWRQTLIGFGLGFGSLALAGAFSLLLGARTFRLAPNLPISLLKYLGVGALVAVIEETFFRGAIQGTLQRVWSGVAAVLMTSFVYAVLHFVRAPYFDISSGAVHWNTGFVYLATAVSEPAHKPGMLVALVTLSLAGCNLGWAFAKTRVLYLAIGLHAGWVFTMKMYSVLTTATVAPQPRWLGAERLTENITTWPVLLLLLAVITWWCRHDLDPSTTSGNSPA